MLHMNPICYVYNLCLFSLLMHLQNILMPFYRLGINCSCRETLAIQNDDAILTEPRFNF